MNKRPFALNFKACRKCGRLRHHTIPHCTVCNRKRRGGPR